jgi:phosphatidate cytidylyltransferase
VGSLSAAASAIASWEYYRLALGHPGFPGWIGIGGAAALPLLPAALPGGASSAALVVCASVSAVAWIYYVVAGPRAAAPERIGHLLAGFCFSSLGLFALVVLRTSPGGLVWALAAVAGSWGNDTAGFFVGRALGRHKLLPQVSPGKTWEGFVAGMVGGTTAIGLACGVWLGLGVSDCIALGVLTGGFGPLGDLSKSMLKRAYHVKDSGKLFPGHGGMLDRIDTILFNAPAVLAYRVLFGGH